MLAHDIKSILTLVPAIQPMVKKANLEEEYPLDNADGCIASNARYHYRTKVASKMIPDLDLALKLEKAAQMYGVQDKVQIIKEALDAVSEAKKNDQIDNLFTLPVKQAEALFEGNLADFLDIEKAAEEAVSLVETYGDSITSEEVKRYSGEAFFDKTAAIQALNARADVTGKPVFSKVAEIVERSTGEILSSQEARDICRHVTTLDKMANLDVKGFNFYKEAMITKTAKVRSALMVKICGKPVPYEHIARFGSDRIGSILGKDVAAALTGDPLNDKQIIESLPLDHQRILQRVIKSS